VSFFIVSVFSGFQIEFFDGRFFERMLKPLCHTTEFPFKIDIMPCRENFARGVPARSAILQNAEEL